MKRKSQFGKWHLALLAFILVLSSGMVWHWYQLRWQQAKLPYLAELGLPAQPFTVLMLGEDVTYNWQGRSQIPVKSAFTGRSDTIVVVRVDPVRRSFIGVQIPRDTVVDIPRYGRQKVNAANALGGPQLAQATVSQLLNTPIDHYLLLNVDGLVQAVNELGGVTVMVPKRMSYMDWTAKLKIDLEPGVHTLTGNQAMGFVRFRHDEMGDIGRVQRQQIFMHALLAKLMNPSSWNHIPRLIAIFHENVQTDLSDLQLIQAFNLARLTPRDRIHVTTLPGRFGSYGSWIAEQMSFDQIISAPPLMPAADAAVRRTGMQAASANELKQTY